MRDLSLTERTPLVDVENTVYRFFFDRNNLVPSSDYLRIPDNARYPIGYVSRTAVHEVEMFLSTVKLYAEGKKNREDLINIFNMKQIPQWLQCEMLEYAEEYKENTKNGMG